MLMATNTSEWKGGNEHGQTIYYHTDGSITERVWENGELKYLKDITSTQAQ